MLSKPLKVAFALWRLGVLQALVLVFLLGGAGSAAATPSAPAKAEHSDVPRLAALWVLEDPQRRITFEQARQSTEWVQAPVSGYAAGYTRSGFWARLRIEGTPGSQVVLTLLPAFSDSVQIIIPANNAGPRLRTTQGIFSTPPGWLGSQQGDFFPIDHRSYDWRSSNADLLLDPKTGTLEVYMRLVTGSASLIHAEVADEESFNASRKKEIIQFTIQAATTLALIVVSSLLFLFYRETLFLLYTAYAICCLTWFALVNGFASQFFPLHPMTTSNLLGLSICLFTAFGIVFLVRLLELEKQTPRIYQMFFVASGLIFLAGPLALLDWYQYFAKWVALSLVMAETFIALLCVWQIRENGVRRQGLLALWILILMCANILMASGFLGAFMPPDKTMALVQAIIFIDLLVLLPMALARAEITRKDRLQTERELLFTQQALDLQRESHKAYREWVAMITHEIKTPLSVIDASRQTIDTLTESPNVHDRTRKIQRAIQRIDTLVMSFLAEDEIEQRSRALQKRRWTYDQIIKNIRDYLPDSILQCLTVQIMNGSQSLDVDLDLLSVALRNLIKNGYQHSQDSRMTLSIQDDSESSRSIFKVSSRGNALDAERESRLFERYQRFGPSSGSGIGLWTCREVARAHGGDTSYLRSPDGENVFALWLPRLSGQ